MIAFGKGKPFSGMGHLVVQNTLPAIHVVAVQPVAVRLIIMQCQDIRYCVFPSIIANHRPHGIYRLGHIINPNCKILLSLVCPDLRNSPGFIEGCPYNNTGVIVILFYNGEPFPAESFYGIIIEAIGGRSLAPY